MLDAAPSAVTHLYAALQASEKLAICIKVCFRHTANPRPRSRKLEVITCNDFPGMTCG